MINPESQAQLLPLVSIGVPVYNEARFLQESLDSLLAQDYANLEIIISDNASTDETQSICERYAEQHTHIQYHRRQENCGPAGNFVAVLEQAKGRYFIWAAGHDLWSSNYISACVTSLEQRPEAVLALGTAQWIDEHGAVLTKETGWTDTRGMDVIARYFSVLWGNMHPVLGLVRREQLAAFPMINTVGADLIILSRLALVGDFVHVLSASWSRREFRQEQQYEDKLKRYKSRAYGLSSSLLGRLFPFARLPVELVKGVFVSEQKLWVRLLIILLLLPSFPVRYVAGRIKPQ